MLKNSNEESLKILREEAKVKESHYLEEIELLKKKEKEI